MPTSFQTATELRGLGLPARQGVEGYFGSKGQFDVAWGDILMAILTPQGSRPMNRSFGSNLHEVLFEPITEEFETVKFIVKDAVTKSCPHLRLQSVSVVAVDETLQVSVIFSLKSDLSASTERTVLIRKTDISLAR